MSKPISAETNKRIRALIREGFAFSHIADECGVSGPTVARQAALLEVLGQFKKPTRHEVQQRANEARAKRSDIRKQLLTRGMDVDEAGIDLVSLFETPRTPKQLKRYWSGE